MKKKIIMSVTAVLILSLFVLLLNVFGKNIDAKNSHENWESEYYQARSDVEHEMTTKAIKDAKLVLKTLQDDEARGKEDCKAKVLACLKGLEKQFPALQSERRIDIDTAAEAAYSLSFIYNLVIYSDIDQKVFTKEEKTLRDTNVYQFTDCAHKYIIETLSNTQEKGEYLVADMIFKEIRKDLKGETAEFAEALAAAVRSKG